jgi:hypothetical protein
MAISFPLTPPTSPGFVAREFQPRTAVGMHMSPFTFSQQVYAWPGQMLTFSLELPPMSDAEAGPWNAFFLALNGREGTFYLGDPVRLTSRGTVGGSWVCNGAQTAGSTTLTLKSGTGVAAVGDWLQVATTTSSRLHRVMQVNLSGGAMISVDVFPRLRAAHTDNTAVSFTNPKGIFRLADLPTENFDRDSLARGVSFSAIEAL